MSERCTIKTAYGPVQLHAAPFLTHPDILITSEPHALLIENHPTVIPPGTPYIRNLELARRTKGRVSHMLVRGGLYDLWRLTSHITDGSGSEKRLMNIRLEDLKACAEAQRVSGCLTDKEARQIQKSLLLLQPDFVEPKRAPRKLLAGDRIVQARKLGRVSRRDPRKIGPSTMVTYAAGRHVRARIDELFGISHFFNRRATRVYARLMAITDVVEALWRFVAGTPLGDRFGHADHRAGGLKSLFEALQRSRRADASRMLARHIDDYRESIQEITEQPFRALILQIDSLLDRLVTIAAAGERRALAEPAHALKRAVRRLRMIHYFEIRVVSVLSFYLQRTRGPDRSLNDASVKMFLDRLALASSKVEAFGPNDLQPDVRGGFLVGCATSRALLEDGSYELAKEVLKDSVLALSDPSYALPTQTT